MTVGHGTKYSLLPPAVLAALGRRLAVAGVAVSVLPATKLLVTGRHQDHAEAPGVADVNAPVQCGVDCSLTRMANLCASMVQRGNDDELVECFEMITRRTRAPSLRGEKPGNRRVRPWTRVPLLALVPERGRSHHGPPPAQPEYARLQSRTFDETFRGPLDGIRVLDLSRLVAGNMLSLQLADHGADVVKVEPPQKGDPLRHWRTRGVSVSWKVYGRNKRSVTLNLRHDRGRGLLLDLVGSAQVLIENYTPGTLEKMGLAPAVLLERNPALVVVRISGFGQTGPYRYRPGFGTLVEAMSGFAYRNGFEDREPVLPPLAMADMIAGIQGAFAVMMALREVELKGGAGQVIDLSLLEPIFSILGAEAAWHRLTGNVRKRVGSGSTTASPRNVYRTRDGRWLAMSGSMQSMAERIFRVIGRDDMNHDPRYRTNEDRVAHRNEVDAAVGGWIARRTLDDCMAVFEREQVTVAPVYDIAQICDDPHFNEREVIVELPDAELGSLPHHDVFPRMSRTPGGFRRPAPDLGQHNAAVLGELGLTASDVAALERDGVL